MSNVILVADTFNKRIRAVQYSPFSLQACDGTWHHVALTYTPTPAPSLSSFLDGALVLASAGASITLPAAASSVLTVGWSGDLTANGGSLFAGALADLRIYSRALSTAEVVALSQPPLSAFGGAANAVPAASPSPGATAYAFSCAAGTRGGGGSSLSRSAADGSWAWTGQPCDYCPPGTYSLAGAAFCALCPANTYGSSAGLATASCSGPCPGCAAGTAYPPPAASLSCASGGARAAPAALGLLLWPAAHPQNNAAVDTIVAPLERCRQLTSAAACAAAASVLGADGITRYAVGTAAALHLEAAEPLTCSASA